MASKTGTTTNAINKAVKGLSSGRTPINPSQDFSYGTKDLSESMVKEGKWLFLQDASQSSSSKGCSTIFVWTGDPNKVGDITKPNRLLSLRLNKTDTEILQTSFFIQPVVVNRDGGNDNIQWQKRLSTLMLLLWSNFLSLQGDLTQTEQKRAFLYVFIMKNSSLTQARKQSMFNDKINEMFAASVENPLSDLATVGVDLRQETPREEEAVAQEKPREEEAVAALTKELEEAQQNLASVIQNNTDLKNQLDEMTGEKQPRDAELEESLEEDGQPETGYQPDQKADEIKKLKKELESQRGGFEARLEEADAKAQKEIQWYKESANALARFLRYYTGEPSGDSKPTTPPLPLQSKLSRETTLEVTGENEENKSKLKELIDSLAKGAKFSEVLETKNSSLTKELTRLRDENEKLKKAAKETASGESNLSSTKQESAVEELLRAQRRQVKAMEARASTEQSQWEKDKEAMGPLLERSDKLNFHLQVVNRDTAAYGVNQDTTAYDGAEGKQPKTKTLKKGTLVLKDRSPSLTSGESKEEYALVYLLDGREGKTVEELLIDVASLEYPANAKFKDLIRRQKEENDQLKAGIEQELAAELKKWEETFQGSAEEELEGDALAARNQRRQSTLAAVRGQYAGKIRVLETIAKRQLRELYLEQEEIAWKLHPNKYAYDDTRMTGTGVDFLDEWKTLLDGLDDEEKEKQEDNGMLKDHRKQIRELLKESRDKEDKTKDVKLGTVLADTDLLLWKDQSTVVGRIKEGTKILCVEEMGEGMITNTYCNIVVLDYREGMIEQYEGDWFGRGRTTMEKLLELNQEGKLCLQKTSKANGLINATSLYSNEDDVDENTPSLLPFAVAMWPQVYQYIEKPLVKEAYKPLDPFRPRTVDGRQARTGFQDWNYFLRRKRKGEDVARAAEQISEQQREELAAGKFVEEKKEKEEPVQTPTSGLDDDAVVAFNDQLVEMLKDTRQRLGVGERDLFLGFLNAESTDIYRVGEIKEEGDVPVRVGFAKKGALVLCLSHELRGGKRVARVVLLDQKLIDADKEELSDYEMYYWNPGSDGGEAIDNGYDSIKGNAISNFEYEAEGDGKIWIDNFVAGLGEKGKLALLKQIDAYLGEKGTTTMLEQRQELENETNKSFKAVKQEIKSYLKKGENVRLKEKGEVVQTSIRLARITGENPDERKKVRRTTGGVQTWDWDGFYNRVSWRGSETGKIQVGARVLVLLDKTTTVTQTNYSKIRLLDDREEFADEAVHKHDREGKTPYLAIVTKGHLDFVTEPTDDDVVALQTRKLVEENRGLSDYILGPNLIEKFKAYSDPRTDTQEDSYDEWEGEIKKNVKEEEEEEEEEEVGAEEEEEEEGEEEEEEGEGSGGEGEEEAETPPFTRWLKPGKRKPWVQVTMQTLDKNDGAWYSGQALEGGKTIKSQKDPQTNEEREEEKKKQQEENAKKKAREEAKKEAKTRSVTAAAAESKSGPRTRGRSGGGRYMEEGMIDE